MLGVYRGGFYLLYDLSTPMTAHERHPLPIGPSPGPTSHLRTSQGTASLSTFSPIPPSIALLTKGAQKHPLVAHLEAKLPQLPFQVSDLIVEIANNFARDLQLGMQLGREF